MEPYSIHCTCSAIIEDLSKLKSVYPRVRVKYTLQRKTYGSSFAIKIQTRKNVNVDIIIIYGTQFKYIFLG